MSGFRKKNKSGNFLATCLLTISLSSIISLLGYNVNNSYASSDSSYMYSQKECEALGFTYDADGSGVAGVGCLVDRYMGEGKWQSDPIGTPADLKKHASQYKKSSNIECAIGWYSTKIDGIEICKTDDLKLKDRNSGLPKGSSIDNFIDKDKCISIGGIWQLKTGNNASVWSRRKCMVNTGDGVTAFNNLSSIPSKYYTKTKCASGFNMSKDKTVQTYHDANSLDWWGSERLSVYTCTKKGSTDDSLLNECLKSGKTQEECENQNSQPGGGVAGETSCAIDNIGWIICPTTNFMASVVQNAYKWIAEEFLTIKSNLLFQSDSNTFKYWANFRDIANILFVILFVVIIFSQITNIGLSNYGLKKMLPRLLVFVVLINVSYWVSVIFVDASNILGREIFNVLSSEEMKGITSLESDVTSVLAAASGAALAYSGGIFLSLIAAIVAILVVLATLVIRQAAVVILIVISPIAFASAILPGTESLFSRWKSILKAMLIVYPVSSLLVGGMLTASNILVGTTERIGGVNGFGLRVIYTLLPIAGLVSIFAVIKGALAAIDKLTGGSITGKLNSMASGLNKAAEKSPIGSLDKGINSRIAAKYQQFGGGKIFRRANRFAKAGEESRARALRDAQISDYEKMGSLNSGQELHLSKLRSDRQKEADLLTSSRSLALSNEIGSKSGEYIAKAEAALNRQDGEELGVILDSIMTNPRLSGKDRMAKISEIISKMSAEQAGSGAVQKAMATFAGKHGGNIKKDDPALLKTIGSLADESKKSGAEIYQEHASNVETYKDASQSDAAGWNPQALANIEKYKSGWSAHDAEIVGAKSAAVLGDERLRHSISEAQRELHQKIATDAGLKISHDDSTNSTQADIAQALKDLNSTIKQQNQQPTQQRQAPQPRGPRRWR